MSTILIVELFFNFFPFFEFKMTIVSSIREGILSYLGIFVWYEIYDKTYACILSILSRSIFIQNEGVWKVNFVSMELKMKSVVGQLCNGLDLQNNFALIYQK
jgi:hypothetical protein